ncbi:MAG: hypothetical protein RI575_10720 [Balneolaceae bacterium]|nr:hypothetical protein [Balneolaceae bacterium]MDR9407846.1 hypothetical protein [Balneolaceae bacterium]
MGTTLLIVGSLSNYFALERGQLAEELIEESRIGEIYGSIHGHESAD